ncbi:hypothetical protein [Amycolatopsis solani]|uniref:hypothetical protein n=1 Tax=Amycolatopsis solani TaxID=3028615 RepID=UPI0025AF48B2|nr:hypothetical protein [Amycolatopsis sp. MEP2-6]
MLSSGEARALCAEADVGTALSVLRREGVGPVALRGLLSQWEKTGRKSYPSAVDLVDGHGRSTSAAIHVPAGARPGQLGALVVLHGAGGSGKQVLPQFTTLGDRVGSAVICPTARVPPRTGNGLDMAGIFGNRFAKPSWDLRSGDLALAALRWARTELGVDPDRCVVAGVSMGGLATWNLGMRFWPHFAAAVPINGALSMWEMFGTDRRSRALVPNLRPLPLFVVHGSEDEQIPPHFDRRSVAELRELGHQELEYAEVRGGRHGLETLGLDDGMPLHRRLEQWLTRRRRTGSPVEVRHRADEDRHGRAFWVRLGGIGPSEAGEVRAHRRTPGRVVIEVARAATVTLYLSTEWAAPGDKIEVSVNGVTSTVRFEPDLATVVASFKETADPALIAEQVVSFAVPRTTAHTPSDTEARDDAAHPI